MGHAQSNGHVTAVVTSRDPEGQGRDPDKFKA